MKNFLINQKSISMTIPEFMQYSNGTISLNDILSKRESEHVLNTMLNNKMFQRFAIYFIACLLFTCKLCYGADLSKVDTAGAVLLTVVRTFGYWVCIIMGIVSIIRAMLNGDTKGIGKIMAKYLLGFSSFYALPWLMDIIKGIFQ